MRSDAQKPRSLMLLPTGALDNGRDTRSPALLRLCRAEHSASAASSAGMPTADDVGEPCSADMPASLARFGAFAWGCCGCWWWPPDDDDGGACDGGDDAACVHMPGVTTGGDRGCDSDCVGEGDDNGTVVAPTRAREANSGGGRPSPGTADDDTLMPEPVRATGGGSAMPPTPTPLTLPPPATDAAPAVASDVAAAAPPPAPSPLTTALLRTAVAVGDVTVLPSVRSAGCVCGRGTPPDAAASDCDCCCCSGAMARATDASTDTAAEGCRSDPSADRVGVVARSGDTSAPPPVAAVAVAAAAPGGGLAKPYAAAAAAAEGSDDGGDCPTTIAGLTAGRGVCSRAASGTPPCVGGGGAMRCADADALGGPTEVPVKPPPSRCCARRPSAPWDCSMLLTLAGIGTSPSHGTPQSTVEAPPPREKMARRRLSPSSAAAAAAALLLPPPYPPPYPCLPPPLAPASAAPAAAAAAAAAERRNMGARVGCLPYRCDGAGHGGTARNTGGDCSGCGRNTPPAAGGGDGGDADAPPWSMDARVSVGSGAGSRYVTCGSVHTRSLASRFSTL
jgi:hypothetical protein